MSKRQIALFFEPYIPTIKRVILLRCLFLSWVLEAFHYQKGYF